MTARRSTKRSARMRRPAVMAVIFATSLLMATTALAAVVPTVGLGNAEPFAVLAGQTITNANATTITGNVGLDPGTSVTGFGSVTLVPPSVLHVDDAVAEAAKAALTTAYLDAFGRSLTSPLIPTELGGQTLVGGVYAADSGTFQITSGVLTLDGENNPDTVWIFKMGSELLASSGGSFLLTRGAQACNVFWQVGSSATIGSGASFVGTILALTSIFIQSGATIQGRALAQNGEVTMDNNTITRAVCLPSGPVDTGGGSTSGIENGRLLLIGAILLTGSFGIVTTRRRHPRRGLSS